MKVQYDPALMEEVISLAVNRGEKRDDYRLFQEYHDLADALYERFSSEEREEAFLKLHRKLFQRWGFGEHLLKVLGELQGLRGLEEVFVARALARKEEGADLSQDRSSLGVKVRPERFLEAEGLRWFLRHELQHIADMLDPAFDYIPHETPLASSPTEENLIKDRYRTLWAISVDGRLWRGGRETIASKEDRWQEFEALYPTIPHQQLSLLFNDLWGGDRPSHRELLAMARDPRRLFKPTGEMVEEGLPKKVLLPGALCPLCRFPTYRWGEDFEEEVAKRIKEDFPAWEPEEGACERCVEVYALGIISAGL